MVKGCIFLFISSQLPIVIIASFLGTPGEHISFFYIFGNWSGKTGTLVTRESNLSKEKETNTVHCEIGAWMFCPHGRDFSLNFVKVPRESVGSALLKAQSQRYRI